MPQKVWIDADACPRKAKEILNQLQATIGFELIIVSSFNHSQTGDNLIMVGNEAEATDLAIINRVSPGDLVITQDWGLAALVLSKQAKAVSPKGLIFTADNIDFMLDERSTKAKLRRQGKRTKGPAPRTAADDERFKTAVLETGGWI